VKSQEYIRTEEDLRRAVQAQFRALKISADHFDLGEMGEAARMASALFILAGEGMRTHTSIFDAAGQKANRLYRSTKTTENAVGCSLVYAQLKKVGPDEWEVGLRHAGRAALKDGRDLPFSGWWNELVVKNSTVELSRADVVRILRDENGGAHFDPIVKDSTVAAAIRGEVGLFDMKHPNGDREVIPFGLEFCMRQVATEFWYSLDENKNFDEKYNNHCDTRLGEPAAAAAC
jgi:hypothetical protein